MVPVSHLGDDPLSQPSHRPAIDHHAPPTKIPGNPGAAVVVAVAVVVVVVAPASSLRRLSAPPLAIGRGLGRHVTRIHRLTPFPRANRPRPPSLWKKRKMREQGQRGERERRRKTVWCCGTTTRRKKGTRVYEGRKKEGRKEGGKGRKGKERRTHASATGELTSTR